ncbi:N-acetyltransferase [Vogesella sp. LIG4]|uniref:N-acetyltransferase n=1 Tax=Vogesella sp. LIG4 TaxID=1192162 RepID=UPI0012FE4AAF|nr:N-acetyltransferase [Vogesella sp. LIG4]
MTETHKCIMSMSITYFVANMSTVAEFLALLDAEPFSTSDVIATDCIASCEGGDVTCTVHYGLDPVKARACDRTWTRFNDELLAFVMGNFEGDERKEVFGTLSLEDAHWEWLAKAAHYRGDEYKWFFLMANGEPQAACMIYHPKASVFGSGDIFYIEYVATAPWNRPNPYKPRVLKGAVPLLLRHVIQYAHAVLNLRYGFSLHALPKACSFYERIGMTPHPKFDKDPLAFYEMEQEKAQTFVEA